MFAIQIPTENKGWIYITEGFGAVKSFDSFEEAVEASKTWTNSRVVEYEPVTA